MKKPPPPTKNSKETDSERFIRVARELGVDEDAPVEEFMEKLKVVLAAKPVKRVARKKPKR